MPRLPLKVRHDDGSLTLRCTLPRPIVLVLDRIASDLKVTEDAALRIMLTHIAGMFERGQAQYFGPLFENALKTVRADNLGVIANGPQIDLSKLHRSDKTKSGFVGVYATGKGFRAMGKKVGSGGGGEQYLGTFETAEEAAWRRYVYYKDNKLPYGELEVEIEKWRKRGEPGDDEFLANEILNYAADVGTLHHFMSEEEANKFMAERNKAPAPTGLIGFDDATSKALLDS